METLKGITSFIKCVETGSIVKAASVQGLSSAAVSKNIQRLERALNVRLLNRTTRSISLTEEGQFLFERYRKAMNELELASLQLAQYQETPSGVLRITLAKAFGMQVILPLIPGFLARYPSIVLDLDFENQPGDLIAGKFDIGIRSGSMSDSNFIARKLAPMHFNIYGSPEYFADNPKPKTPEDLKHHQCISFRHPVTGKTIPWEFTKDGVKQTIEAQGPLIVNTQEATCEAGLMGLGIVRLDAYFAASLLKEGKLERVLSNYDTKHDAYYAYYPSREFQSPKTRVFIDYILSEIVELDL